MLLEEGRRALFRIVQDFFDLLVNKVPATLARFYLRDVTSVFSEHTKPCNSHVGVLGCGFEVTTASASDTIRANEELFSTVTAHSAIYLSEQLLLVHAYLVGVARHKVSRTKGTTPCHNRRLVYFFGIFIEVAGDCVASFMEGGV